MAEFVGGLLGGITGLVGAMMQAQAQAQANAINWRALQFQKQMAEKGFDVSTAARTDPYGNKTYYDELLNEWINQLTPTQQQLISAGEREQLLSLTEDAPRARELRRAQAGRAKEAGKDFDRALAGYRYDQPPSEGAEQDELVRSLLINRQKGLGEGLRGITGQALRIGRGRDIPALIKAADDLFGRSLEETTLKGKQAGSAMHQAKRAAHENIYGSALDRFSGLADKVNPTTARFSDAPQRMGEVQDAMQRAISAAISGGAANVGNAYTNLASGLSQSPDLSNIVRALSSMTFGSGGETPSFLASTAEPYNLGFLPDDRLYNDKGIF
jgi:hypothetical protein